MVTAPDSGFGGDWSLLVLRAIGFLVLFALLQFGWQSLHGTSAEYVVIHDFTVRPAAAIVNSLTPSVGVRSVGFSLEAPGGGLNIENGCEGLEAFFLLFAAFIVSPMRGRYRLGGLALGMVLVFAVNELRIVALFYAARADRALFDPLHADVAPVLVVLILCAYFYAWLDFATHRAAA